MVNFYPFPWPYVEGQYDIGPSERMHTMKYKYGFCNEAVEIDVPEEWGRVLQDLDREEYNNDHKERRRSISLEVFDPDELPVIDNVELTVLSTVDTARVKRGLRQLPPRQRYLIEQVYFENRTYASIAREEEKDEAAIRKATQRAFVNLKNKLLKK